MSKEEDKAAAKMQAAMRGKNARAEGKGKDAKEAAGAKKKETKQEKEAAKAAARLAAAENAFAEADTSGDGAVDVEELKGLLLRLLSKEGYSVDKAAVSAFVEKEFKDADADGDGQVDFEEFVNYYNQFLDRVAQGQLDAALDAAAAAAAKKVEGEVLAQDDEVYASLHQLLALLHAPSLKARLYGEGGRAAGPPRDTARRG